MHCPFFFKKSIISQHCFSSFSKLDAPSTSFPRKVALTQFSSVKSNLFFSTIGARTLKMPVPYPPPNVGSYTRTLVTTTRGRLEGHRSPSLRVVTSHFLQVVGLPDYSFYRSLILGIQRTRELPYSPWPPLRIPSAITPNGQLHQSPPSPIPGDQACGKRRGFSPGAAARHSQHARAYADSRRK